MWLQHWNLTSDPFLGSDVPYVETPVHAEAVARLCDLVETGQPVGIVRAAEGLGKSAVLAESLRRLRGSGRRFARVDHPADGAGLASELCRELGARAGRRGPWRDLADAIRVNAWMNQQTVLAVDGAEFLRRRDGHSDGDAELDHLLRLPALAPGRCTVLLNLRDEEGRLGRAFGPAWRLAVRLRPLSRDETEGYVRGLLYFAGRSDPLFTPRAFTRLHFWSAGVPRGIHRLASLALMAGAWRRLEIIPPDVVDGVAAECEIPG